MKASTLPKLVPISRSVRPLPSSTVAWGAVFSPGALISGSGLSLTDTSSHRRPAPGGAKLRPPAWVRLMVSVRVAAGLSLVVVKDSAWITASTAASEALLTNWMEKVLPLPPLTTPLTRVPL